MQEKNAKLITKNAYLAEKALSNAWFGVASGSLDQSRAFG
jgi:hypothetical protein